jgi:uncharacterized membrane protein
MQMQPWQIAALLWIGSTVLFCGAILQMVKRGRDTNLMGTLIIIVVFFPAVVYTLCFMVEDGMPVWKVLLLWPIAAIAVSQLPAWKR